jgi:hypothetical protein
VRFWHITLVILCGISLGVLAGCQPADEIRHYRVSKPETRPEPEPKVRLLAGIFRHQDKTWFFKFMGPAADVKEHQAEYDRFIHSVRISDQEGKPLSWSLPDGWTHEAGKNPLRFATFRFGSKERPLELTVTSLDGEAGSLMANLNRWRGQIGLKPIAEENIKKIARAENINGVDAILVEMSGPGGASKGMGP